MSYFSTCLTKALKKFFEWGKTRAREREGAKEENGRVKEGEIRAKRYSKLRQSLSFLSIQQFTERINQANKMEDYDY